MDTCIYLRKSRADEELEKEIGKGETLARHRKALLKYAGENNLNIIEIYEELESGDSIIHRPAMLQLLKDIEKGLYDAVLVIDIYRLGRGDMEDQGLILNTLKRSNTRIITPDKSYDLNNEYDEEYAEFESFMGRKEYKMIRKRLQNGRIRSVNEGNYIATYPPYGYEIVEGKHYRTLAPHPEQADIIKLIFDLYVNQDIGCAKIAGKLNEMGVKTYWDKSRWERTMITQVIKNQVYIGKLVWKKKCIRKSTTPGKSKDTYTRDRSEWIVTDGRHPALVDEDTFNRAQEIISSKYHVPYQIVNGLSNPLAGLIVCRKCGYKMKRRPYPSGAHLICEHCDNKSARMDLVERRVLILLESMLKHYKVQLKGSFIKQDNMKIDIYQKQLTDLEKELENLNRQKTRIYDLLERDEYTMEVFLERSRNISNRMDDTLNGIKEIKKSINAENERNNAVTNLIPLWENVLSAYKATDDVEEKNNILKKIIDQIDYYKSKDQKGDNFELNVIPKVLKISGS